MTLAAIRLGTHRVVRALQRAEARCAPVRTFAGGATAAGVARVAARLREGLAGTGLTTDARRGPERNDRSIVGTRRARGAAASRVGSIARALEGGESLLFRRADSEPQGRAATVGRVGHGNAVRVNRARTVYRRDEAASTSGGSASTAVATHAGSSADARVSSRPACPSNSGGPRCARATRACHSDGAAATPARDASACRTSLAARSTDATAGRGATAAADATLVG
jgi:hypothetical protein